MREWAFIPMLLTATRQLSTVRHESPAGRWTMVTGELHPGLRDFVVSWCGFEEWTPGVTRRRQVPGGFVPLIIDFLPSYRVAPATAPDAWALRRFGFAAGVHDQFALTESSGLARAMQIDFTPIGAHLFFGRPMSDLTNLVVGLDDLFGADGVRLVDRLVDARDWETRFDILEEFVLRRLQGAPTPSPGVSWAWRQLRRSDGQVEIGRLAAELGCSRKHLITQFHEQIGAAPKTIARILRFQHAVRLFNAPSGTNAVTGADVAIACGYFDQAHFIKDFRQLSGLTPTEFLRHRIPDLSGLAAD
jgi:AraC-like DNA-binding protein